MPDQPYRSSLTTTYRRTKNSIKALIAAVCAGFAVSVSQNASADPFATFDAELAYTSDTNITRAQYDADILRDQFASVSVGATHLQWLNATNRIVYRGFVRDEKYRQYDGLSNIQAGLNFTYQYRESGTFSAPLYGIFAKGAVDEYKSTLRDSNLYSVGFSVRKPYTDRIQFTSILTGNLRDSEGTVWDTKDVSLLLSTDYSLNSDWTLYLTYSFIKGDIVSTTISTTTNRLAFVDHADAINVDDAFGGNAIAYRLKGYTNLVTLGTNWRVAEKQSFDLSARWIRSDAAAEISYTKWQFSLAFLSKF